VNGTIVISGKFPPPTFLRNSCGSPEALRDPGGKPRYTVASRESDDEVANCSVTNGPIRPPTEGAAELGEVQTKPPMAVPKPVELDPYSALEDLDLERDVDFGRDIEFW
jgi:hypothetical protein